VECKGRTSRTRGLLSEIPAASKCILDLREISLGEASEVTDARRFGEEAAADGREDLPQLNAEVVCDLSGRESVWHDALYSVP
jgi:hypothetical protein